MKDYNQFLSVMYENDNSDLPSLIGIHGNSEDIHVYMVHMILESMI